MKLNRFSSLCLKEINVPISGKEMRKLFRKAGYEVVSGGGKGSHWKLKKQGAPTVTIPNHKELATGTEHALKKLLKKAKN
jgi:predicted RNA binding protein YcfA (HicA-like mRNA interferase family)